MKNQSIKLNQPINSLTLLIVDKHLRIILLKPNILDLEPLRILLDKQETAWMVSFISKPTSVVTVTVPLQLVVSELTV